MEAIAYIPWFAGIVIIGIIAGAVITMFSTRNGRKTELAQALKQNAEVNERLIARLEGIESRLSSVEKALNDIPE